MLNDADYFTKHHPVQHHRKLRGRYVKDLPEKTKLVTQGALNMYKVPSFTEQYQSNPREEKITTTVSVPNAPLTRVFPLTPFGVRGCAETPAIGAVLPKRTTSMTSDIREESRYCLMERGQDSNIGRYR